jgi:AAHS family 4-hydroxybenzoate transporter-like MFS transporter
LTEMIDQHPIGAYQIRIVLLCALVAALDGFDLLVIGVAAPAMTDALQIAPQQFGTVLGASVLGLMLGAFCLGPASDRFGRRRILIGTTAAFGLFSICTASATTPHQVLLFRFLTGIGLGGAMPSFISLVAEYMPQRRRAAVIGLLWTGFPLGGVAVGLLASRLLDAFGWQSLFYFGGIFPLALSLVLIWALPETPSFLIAKHTPWPDIRDLAIRINPTVEIPPGSAFVVGDKSVRGVPVWHLFTDARAFRTVLLWASYFGAFLMLVTNSVWTPTLLREAGIDVAHSAIAVAVFALGSVFGTPLAGFLIGRFAARVVLPVAFLASALALGAVGYGDSSFAMVIALQALAGFFLGVGSSGLIALTASFYPTAIRSTGLGWAMGFGRFGSLVGPLAIGLLVARGLQPDITFAVLAAPAPLAALFTALIKLDRRPGSGLDPALAVIE